MTTFSEKQKREGLEEYHSVAALYQVLNENRAALRVRQNMYHGEELQPLEIDFLLDVELKAKRVLPLDLLHMFSSLVANSTPELLPETARVLLGQTWKEYGLGVEGSYRVLYFKAKNAQVRSFLEESYNGMFGATDTDTTRTATGAILDCFDSTGEVDA